MDIIELNVLDVLRSLDEIQRSALKRSSVGVNYGVVIRDLRAGAAKETGEGSQMSLFVHAVLEFAKREINVSVSSLIITQGRQTDMM